MIQVFLNMFNIVLSFVIKSVHKYNTFNSGIAKQQFLKFLFNIRAVLLLSFFFVSLLAKPMDIISSHRNSTKDDNRTLGKILST